MSEINELLKSTELEKFENLFKDLSVSAHYPCPVDALIGDLESGLLAYFATYMDSNDPNSEHINKKEDFHEKLSSFIDNLNEVSNYLDLTRGFYTSANGINLHIEGIPLASRLAPQAQAGGWISGDISDYYDTRKYKRALKDLLELFGRTRDIMQDIIDTYGECKDELEDYCDRNEDFRNLVNVETAIEDATERSEELESEYEEAVELFENFVDAYDELADLCTSYGIS